MIGLLLTIALIVVLFGLTIWGMRVLSPGHPVIIDNGLWVLCVVICLLLVARAFGVADIPVPRLGRY